MRGWNKNIRVNVILDVFCMLTADELRASADTKEPRRLICQAACMKYSCYPAASGKWASFFDRVTLGKHFRLSSTTAGGLFRCEGGAISQICWTLSASLIGFQQPAVSKQMTSCCTYRIPCRDDPPTGEGGGGSARRCSCENGSSTEQTWRRRADWSLLCPSSCPLHSISMSQAWSRHAHPIGVSSDHFTLKDWNRLFRVSCVCNLYGGRVPASRASSFGLSSDIWPLVWGWWPSLVPIYTHFDLGGVVG